MTLPMLVIDFAWWKPDFNAVREAGYSAIIRYISRDKTKSLTADEIQRAQAAQLGLGVIFEDTAQRALGGAAAGAADGQFANAYADSIGWPKWKPIGYAIDFQPTPAQIPTVIAYVKAAAQQGRVAYGYGSTDVIDALVAAGIPDDWQTCAWSHGVVNTKAALYQRLKPTTSLTGAFDEDVVLHPSNDLWFPGEQPPTEGTPVTIIFATGLDAMTAAGIAFPRRVGLVTTSDQAAKDAIARRDTLIVIGGPAASALGQDPNKLAGTAYVIGTATYLVGKTAEDTRALAEAHLQ